MDDVAAPAWQLSDGELVELLARREEQARRDYAERLALVAEAEGRGLAANLGYQDGVRLLREVLNVVPHEARRRLEHAAATMGTASVTGQRVEPPLPRTGEALCDGEIGPEHVTEIDTVMSEISGRVTHELYDDSEASLVELARQANPAVVRRAGRRILAWVDQDGRAPDEQAQDTPRREFASHYQRSGHLKFTGLLDPETAAQLEGLFGALAKPQRSAETGETDLRTPAQRHGDALAEIIDAAARADEAATQGGERAALTVTVSLAELQQHTQNTILPLASNHTPEALRRLACQAKVIPAVLGTHGEPLDVGRAARVATAPQRRALTLRDGGCTFPGCDRSPKWTNAHHIVHWVDGGPTDLDNLVLLCARHHRRIHHSEWEVTIRDGTAQFFPPRWIDRDRRPRINRAHHPPGQQEAA